MTRSAAGQPIASADIATLLDEREIRRLTTIYARSVDAGDVESFLAIFTPDAILEGEAFRYDTREALAEIPRRLARKYLRTYHTLLDSLIDLSGDEASGTTYSLAYHLTPATEGRANCYVMAITYSDAFQRTADGWRLSRRRLDVLWTEEREVSLTARPK